MGQASSAAAVACRRENFQGNHSGSISKTRSTASVSPMLAREEEGDVNRSGGVVVEGNTDYISDLPDECLAVVFQSLSSADRNRCSLVCRRWLMVEGQSRHRLSLNAQMDLLPGLPVFAVGVGLSTFDKASVHYYVQSHIQINEYRDRVILPSAAKKYGRPITTCIKVLDMTGLKLSALKQIKLLSIISSIDDLNYPEKTNTYYIVNAPYIFSACWKVVKPLLHERTRKKVQVLPGSGRDELLKIMDYASLPHFSRKEGSGASKSSDSGSGNCYSLDHSFHQELYNYIKGAIQNP